VLGLSLAGPRAAQNRHEPARILQKAMTMRVTIFNNMLYPNNHRVFDYLARTLPISLHLVSCVDREPNRRWLVPKAETYTTHVLKGTWIRLSEGRFAHINYGIWKTLNDTRPDLLIINGVYPSMASARIWSSVRKIPLALYSDGTPSTMPNSAYHKIVRPWVFKGCKAALCCSIQGENFFRDAGFALPAIFKWPLIPAWDAPDVIPSFAQRPFDLLWCAHFNNTVKNVGFFVDVALRLKRGNTALKVRMVGDGPMREQVLSRLRAAAIEVVHDSFLPQEELGRVFTSARLLLLPSVYEPWGLVCNEAAQCGTVCIVSSLVGAAGDLVVDQMNGRVLPLEAEPWAQAARALLDAPANWSAFSSAGRAAMQTRTLKRAADSFSDMVRYALQRSEL
jgi:glycosyltransferase involved in cell wall biosynthesis